jgi:glucokinase
MSAVTGGVDLGGTKIQAVIVDASSKVLAEARHPTPTSGGPEAVTAEIVATLHEAADAAGVEPSSLAGVGVGSPGAVDSGSGVVEGARNLSDWEASFPLGPALESELDTKVRLGNDVQVGIDAEFALGAGRDVSSLLGVFWGTGVGGGLVLDGKPWLGRGAAGEIGHVVVKIGGARCTCGRRGCMEAYAGRAAMEIRARKLVKRGKRTQLFKIMEERDRTRLQSGIWARALKRKDPMAVELVERAIDALGAGIASAVNVLDVDAVVIGGGLGTRLGTPYVKRIEQAMAPHLFVSDRPPPVSVAALGDLGGAIGAALLVKPPAPKRRAAKPKAAAEPATETSSASSG